MTKLEKQLAERFGRGGCRVCIHWLCAGIFYGVIGTVAVYFMYRGWYLQ